MLRGGGTPYGGGTAVKCDGRVTATPRDEGATPYAPRHGARELPHVAPKLGVAVAREPAHAEAQHEPAEMA